MPVFDPGVPWLRGTATLTNGSTTVETDGVITLNEILEGDRLYVFDGGQRIGPFEIVGGEDDEIELREAFEGATGSYSIAIDRNPITRTGAKTLRDVADILGRIGNFGELSERDQISSDLIPIGPERESIKDALDVTKRASNLSDLTNLKQARANLGTFSTVADVQNSHIPAVLESIRTFGRDAPGDGPPLDLVRGLEVPGAVQSADGQWWEDVGYNTITVRIPSDFPTLQSAIDHYSRLPMRQGAVISLLIESGHRLTHGVRVEDGDFSRFHIQAEDSVVYLHSSFPQYGEILSGSRAKLPVLMCLIDAEGGAGCGVLAEFNSDAIILPDCGVKNVGSGGHENSNSPLNGTGLRVSHTSRAMASGSIFSGAYMRNVWLTRTSLLVCDRANFSGSRGDAGLFVSRGSLVYGALLNVSGCAGNALRVGRSLAFVRQSDFSGAGENAVITFEKSIVNLARSDLSNASQHGIYMFQAGATIDASRCDINDCGGHGIYAIAGGNIDVSEGNILRSGLSAIDAREAKVVIEAQKATVSNNSSGSLIRLLDGSEISLFNATVENGAEHNLRLEAGSRAYLRAATLRNATNNDISINSGSTAYANGCSTTNGSGSPALEDVSEPSFNTLSNRGIIFA